MERKTVLEARKLRKEVSSPEGTLTILDGVDLAVAAGERITQLLFDLNAAAGTTLVLVTHDRGLAARCGRMVEIDAGRLVA